MSVDAGKQPWESRLREAGAQVEDELRRVVTYLNDEVVPDVRRNGSAALRAAATELARLAERMERGGGGGAAVPPTARPGPTSRPTGETTGEPKR